MIGCLAAARSLREVEALTASLHGSVRRQTQVKQRISDTKLRDTLMQVDVAQARHALHPGVTVVGHNGAVRFRLSWPARDRLQDRISDPVLPLTYSTVKPEEHCRPGRA